MDCPKCAHVIRDATAVECPACGVLLRKAVSEPPRRTYAAPRPQPAAKAGFQFSLRAVAAIFVIALAVIYIAGRGSGGGTASAPEGWYLGGEGYEQARSAQTDGQAMLVYFYADW